MYRSICFIIDIKIIKELTHISLSIVPEVEQIWSEIDQILNDLKQ